MRVNGQWTCGTDGIYRPRIPGSVRLASGGWESVNFLLDTGADRTVLHAGLLERLGFQDISSSAMAVTGVGGRVATVEVQTTLSFLRDDNESILIHGLYAVFIDEESSDVSVLGRDLTNNFTIICDYPGQTVCLLHPPHSYRIGI